jgi:hypothetical protein
MNRIDRRRFTSGLLLAGTGLAAAGSGLAAASGLVAGTGVAAGAGGLALAGAADAAPNLHRAYRLLRFAADERVFFWWMKGRRYGFVDTVLTPFFDMHVGSMHRCRDLGDGRYELRTASAMYHTDLATGALLESWANPVTGRTVKFSYPAPTAAATTYSYADGIQDGPPPPGMKMERRHVLAPLEIVGDDAWIREESYLTVVYAASGRTQRVHDTYTFSAPVAGLRQSRPRFLPATVHFNDYNGWSPRFEMGDAPGASVARCSGRKVATLDELPASVLTLARRLHGDAFRDPARTLG